MISRSMEKSNLRFLVGTKVGGFTREASYASTLVVCDSDKNERDFNEPCTAVTVKKRTGTPSFCTLLISSVLQLGSNDLTLKKVYLKKGLFGAFHHLASAFDLFVKKDFCALLNSQRY